MKDVAIVILNWNGKKDTLECLESVYSLQFTVECIKIIVVDNGSTDGSVAEISKRYKQSLRPYGLKDIKILRNHQNLGFAEGNNVGIKEALENGADYVMLLNNDTLVGENLMEELLKVAESDPQIGMVSPKIYFAPGFEFHKDRYQENERGKVLWYAGGMIDWNNVYGSHRGVDEVDKGQYEKTEETDFATGCCLLVKREVFEKIGFLDGRYFFYLEDLDFCQRAKRAGYKIIYAPKAVLWHKNAASSGRPGSPLHEYYQTRNRLLFGFRSASLRTKLALLRQSLSLLFSGRPWQKRGVLDFYLGRFGRGSYPI